MKESESKKQIAYLALGSNLGDRLAYLNRAVAALDALPGTRVTGVSKVYETDPVGDAAQGRYLNAAVRVETELSPQALLGAALGIEAACGRVRTRRNGPRTLDVDLLIYGGVRMETKELILPHPRMNQRAFVLRPLADIDKSFQSAYQKVADDAGTLYASLTLPAERRADTI